MEQRGIPLRSIRQTLESPDTVIPDHHGQGRLLARKHIGGTTYYVVFKKPAENQRVVVTVWLKPGSGLVG